MNRVKAKSYCIFLFGSINKCSVTVNKGQIWEVEYCPSETCPFYGLHRKGITIQVPKEDLDREFDVVWE